METPSVQSIDRAISVLRSVCSRRGLGVRLGEVSTMTGLSKSTSHRILSTLIRSGLVEQDADDTTLYPGFELLTIGAAAANRFGLSELAIEGMHRLADRTGDTVFLTARSGIEAVCVERVVGSFPIKTLTLNVGDRRPLGVGAGSLAVLSFLRDDEADRCIEANSERYRSFGKLNTSIIRSLVERSWREGYALNDARVIPDMSAVGVPVRGSNGQPVAAISVAAVSSRLVGRRRQSVVRWLLAEAAKLEASIGPSGKRPPIAAFRDMVRRDEGTNGSRRGSRPSSWGDI